MDPIMYLFEKPALMDRVAGWLLILVEFDLKFHTRKSVDGRAVVEFLADFQVQGEEDQEYEFLNEEPMQITKEIRQFYFDEASNQNRYGARILIVASDDVDIPLTLKLYFEVTNSETEYELCIIRLQAAIELKAEAEDSTLVISRSNGKWKIRIPLTLIK